MCNGPRNVKCSPKLCISRRDSPRRPLSDALWDKPGRVVCSCPVSQRCRCSSSSSALVKGGAVSCFYAAVIAAINPGCLRAAAAPRCVEGRAVHVGDAAANQAPTYPEPPLQPSRRLRNPTTRLSEIGFAFSGPPSWVFAGAWSSSVAPSCSSHGNARPRPWLCLAPTSQESALGRQESSGEMFMTAGGGGREQGSSRSPPNLAVPVKKLVLNKEKWTASRDLASLSALATINKEGIGQR